MNQSKIMFNLIPMLTVAAMFALIACDDSSTDPEDALVGTWVLTNVTYYDSSGTIYEPGYDLSIDSTGRQNWDPFRDSTGQVINLVYTFNSDGTGSVDVNVTTDFTYTATADEITLIFTDGGYVLPYELSGNTLISTAHNPVISTEQMMDENAQISGWRVLTFTKQ